MPITMNQFKCSNGHTFEANAKLRTRCPSCGVMTKRSFAQAVLTGVEPKEEPVVEPKEELKPEPEEPKHKIKTPVLIRQGRPRMAVRKHKPEPVVKAKPKGRTLIGSKVSAGIVKSHTIKRRGVMPTIKRRPVKTAVARTVQHEQKPRFQDEVIRKYGIFGG